MQEQLNDMKHNCMKYDKKPKEQYFYRRTDRNNSYFNLNMILRLYVMFGIDICNFATVKKGTFLLNIIRKLMKFSLMFLAIITISRFYFAIHDYKDVRTTLVVLIINTSSSIMWFYVTKFQEKIKMAFEKLKNIEKMLDIDSPKKLIIILLLIFFAMCTLTTLMHIYEYDEPRYNKIFQDITFNALNYRSTKWHIKALKAFIISFYELVTCYLYFFICFFIKFYIITCRYMVLILSKHIKLNKTMLKLSYLKSEIYDMCFLRYDSIMATFYVINSYLSFPIFLVTTYNVMAIFYGVMSIVRFKTVKNHCTFIIVNAIFFTAITLFASAVNEVDKKAKISNISLLKRLRRNNINHTQTKLDVQEFYTPAFALTGWIFFEFTGKFFLAATGSIATYCLLVANL